MSFNSKQIMSQQEINISFILAFIYSLRMLGIFLVLPVFFLYYLNLSGDNKLLVGIAFGIYGLSQAIFQIPFGILSDKFGRKKIIFIGLIIFALGSFLCAIANNIYFLIVARFIQGSGAVGSVITASLVDFTRDEVRTRAMSVIGSGIAITFSLSLLIAPSLFEFIGMSGIFLFTVFLVICALIIIYYKIPNSKHMYNKRSLNTKFLLNVIKNKKLWHLNFGIFILHCVQMCFFTTMPVILEKYLHFSKNHHWEVYFPSIVLGIIFMIPMVFHAETKFKLKKFLGLGIIFIIISEIILLFFKINNINNILEIFLSLIFYFTGLNVLEAILPSWVSKESPDNFKGTAIGIYNTFMSIGIFIGGLIGGLLQKYFNIEYVFYFSIFLMLIWFFIVYFLDQGRKNVCK